MPHSKSLAVFTNNINKLMQSSLILVDKHIANLLQCVADVPVFTEVLRVTLSNTSYVTEFSRANVTLTRPDGKTENKLKLPIDRNRLFSFVICLLVEVDNGQRVFLDFLKKYYFDKDSNKSYLLFVQEVLKPFKKAGENILKTYDPLSLDEENIKRAEKYFYAERIYISSEQLQQMLAGIESINKLFLEQGKQNMSQQLKQDCSTMIEALIAALHTKNPKLLAIVYTGFKNTLCKIDKVELQLKQLDSLLQQVL